MSSIHVTASGPVGAPAGTVYGILRNYRDHHPHILPDAFKGLTVEEGGIGAGTVFSLQVSAFGKLDTMRMRVDEPEPGRVLREVDIDDGTETTFTVEPMDDSRCTVAVHTEYEPGSGVTGLVDRYVKPSFMRRLYQKELAKLDGYACSVPASDAAADEGHGS